MKKVKPHLSIKSVNLKQINKKIPATGRRCKIRR